MKWQPARRAEFVVDVAGSAEQAAELLEVTPSEVDRWASGETSPGVDVAGRLVDVDHVLAHALLVWADVSVVRDWLTTSNALLDGVRPADLICLGDAAEVVGALRAEATGAYT